MRFFYLLLLCLISQAVATQAQVAQQHQPAAETTSVLTCMQDALGGTAAIAAVSSLHIRAETKPTRDSGLRPPPGTREISVVFPDRYLRADAGDRGLNSSVGFNRDVILSNPRSPDAARAERAAHVDFSRQMLMRLPGKSAGVKLVPRVTNDAAGDQVAIDVSDAHGFAATLLVNRRTCVPRAVEYMVLGAVRGLRRVDLSEYRSFGGVRFPTVLRTSVEGSPFTEERVTSIEVNTPAASRVFAGRR